MIPFNDSRDWIFKKRYGLFVHWGIYAVGGVHEQEQWRYGKPKAEYVRYMDRFRAESFSPAQWLDMAQASGMEYLVFTTKHHDGFCLWDTDCTDFNIMHTPFGKDALALLAEECHRRNFPLMLYYSVVDWHQECYPNLGRHHEIVTNPARHDIPRYMDFLKRQITELCTRYGTIHGIWWDMNVMGIQDPSIRRLIHELQPAAIINDRGFDPGDFTTPDRSFQDEPDSPFRTPTEACDAIGVNSWGYREQEDFHSSYTLERKIATNLALGGNFILNAGPRADGSFPPEATVLLGRIGDWFRAVRPGLTAPPRPKVLARRDGILTTGADRDLYIIVLNPLDSSTLSLAPLDTLPASCTLLNLNRPIDMTLEPISYELANGPSLRLRNIPVEELHGQVPVFHIIRN